MRKRKLNDCSASTALMARFTGQHTSKSSTGAVWNKIFYSKYECEVLKHYLSNLRTFDLVMKLPTDCNASGSVLSSTRQLRGVFVTNKNLALYNEFLDSTSFSFETSPFNLPLLLEKDMGTLHVLLLELCERINMKFNANVNHITIQSYDNNGESHHNAHKDKDRNWIPNASFFVLSIGHTRYFRLGQRCDGIRKIIDEFPLEQGSLLEIPFATNRLYDHDIPKRSFGSGNSKLPRYSLVFRQMKSV